MAPSLKYIALLVLVAGLWLAPSPVLLAQCSTCKSNVESATGSEDGAKRAEGLNSGILFLMAVPYLLVGGVAYFWYRSRRKASETMTEAKKLGNGLS